MVAHKKPPYVPLEIYLEREAVSKSKHEYQDGVIIAMAGASPAHVRITTNLTRLIGNQLEGKPCEPFDSDMRVLVEACHAVYYPDLTVACEPPRFADVPMATLLNPALIVEVLSSSTERADRGIKFDAYRMLASIRAFVLVSQDEPRIELFCRHADGSWTYEVARGLEATLRLEAIGCELQLAEVYTRVEFSPALGGETEG